MFRSYPCMAFSGPSVHGSVVFAEGLPNRVLPLFTTQIPLQNTALCAARVPIQQISAGFDVRLIVSIVTTGPRGWKMFLKEPESFRKMTQGCIYLFFNFTPQQVLCLGNDMARPWSET